MSRNARMTSDLSRAGPVARDIEQAVTALKKGAYLLKYGRRGKPKFCPFRLSNDESVLIWFSGNEEKHLKLSHVSRIISGQRTPIFQRYPRPEKEYQSFSLIYDERSLDVICKDKDEAEVWFSGLKALVSRCHQRRWRTESRSDGTPSEATSPRTYTRRSSPLHSPFSSNGSFQKDGSSHHRLHSPYESPPKNGIDKAFSDMSLYALPPKGFFPSDPAAISVHSLSSGASDSIHGHMKGMSMDAFRVSLSSAISSSSHGSGHDDGDALGDVFIWGEGIGEGVLGGGSHRVGSSLEIKMDSFVPKALESTVVLDVQNIACGGQHGVLVTKQGETFSWGEFKQFPNCRVYDDGKGFVRATLKALGEQPSQLTEQQRHELSWEAATQRFVSASDLNRLARADSNLSKRSLFASSSISVGKNLEDMSAYIHFLASGFETSRTAFGAIPGSLQPDEELCKDLGLTLKTPSRYSLKQD